MKHGIKLQWLLPLAVLAALFLSAFAAPPEEGAAASGGARVLVLWEEGGGPAAEAALSSPQALTAGPDGTLYIADMGSSAIRCLKDGQVTTLTIRDMASTESFFPISPAGMMVYGRRLFVCDSFSRKVVTIALG